MATPGAPTGAASTYDTSLLPKENYNSLGYFQIEKRIGQGQFSVVFRACNTVDGQHVALKKIQVYIHCCHSHVHYYLYMSIFIIISPLLLLSVDLITILLLYCLSIQIFEMVDAKARQDCIKEIELLKSLDHPNIIRYLASFIENNEVCDICRAIVYF